MIFSEQDTLPNGVTIPRLALGTWFLPNQQAAEAVKTALSIGYRHIDTAQAYGNEAGVGEGIRRSGIPREEIFVTSKVAAEHKSYATAAQSIHQTLTTMGLDYVDLMLIHSPQPWAEVNQSDNRYFPENRQVWRALRTPSPPERSGPSGSPTFSRQTWRTCGPRQRSSPWSTKCSVTSPTRPFPYSPSAGAAGSCWRPTPPWPTERPKRTPAIQRMAQRYGSPSPSSAFATTCSWAWWSSQGSKPGAHAGKRLPGLYHLRGGYGPASAPAPHPRLWPLPPLPCVWGQKKNG